MKEVKIAKFYFYNEKNINSFEIEWKSFKLKHSN